jgi:hypothetical protein
MCRSNIELPNQINQSAKEINNTYRHGFLVKVCERLEDSISTQNGTRIQRSKSQLLTIYNLDLLLPHGKGRLKHVGPARLYLSYGQRISAYPVLTTILDCGLS